MFCVVIPQIIVSLAVALYVIHLVRKTKEERDVNSELTESFVVLTRGVCSNGECSNFIRPPVLPLVSNQTQKLCLTRGTDSKGIGEERTPLIPILRSDSSIVKGGMYPFLNSLSVLLFFCQVTSEPDPTPCVRPFDPSVSSRDVRVGVEGPEAVGEPGDSEIT